MAMPQIVQQVITKLRAICAGEPDHVTFTAVVARELFYTFDGFDWGNLPVGGRACYARAD